MAVKSRFTKSGARFWPGSLMVVKGRWARTTPLGGADWIWRAGIDNVTDENYWSGASTSFANYLIQGEPRTFKLSATVEF
ncbi:TonB-dependent receptor [Halomonas sp. N3-2A]|uniref:TonB-dependent receptor n=1 Tax=Halomonas sp. N3-2A TaxID=2014541 RepID=UPI0012FE2DBD|nr:TonB-dependent receptor [Halomonas sp. N3-2A]